MAGHIYKEIPLPNHHFDSFWVSSRKFSGVHPSPSLAHPSFGDCSAHPRTNQSSAALQTAIDQMVEFLSDRKIARKPFQKIISQKFLPSPKGSEGEIDMYIYILYIVTFTGG